MSMEAIDQFGGTGTRIDRVPGPLPGGCHEGA